MTPPSAAGQVLTVNGECGPAVGQGHRFKTKNMTAAVDGGLAGWLAGNMDIGMTAFGAMRQQRIPLCTVLDISWKARMAARHKAGVSGCGKHLGHQGHIAVTVLGVHVELRQLNAFWLGGLTEAGTGISK